MTRHQTAPISDVVTDPSRRALEAGESVDLDAMDKRLGFHEPGHPIITAPETEIEIGSRMLGAIIDFIIESKTVNAMGCRFLGIAACLRPQLFDNMPMARVAGNFGMSKQALAKYFRAVRQRFGLKSIYHKSDEAVENYRVLRTGKRKVILPADSEQEVMSE